jgi:hypothetical protein
MFHIPDLVQDIKRIAAEMVAIVFSREVEPVRVKKTRQNKESRAPFRFNRNEKGSRSPYQPPPANLKPRGIATRHQRNVLLADALDPAEPADRVRFRHVERIIGTEHDVIGARSVSFGKSILPRCGWMLLVRSLTRAFAFGVSPPPGMPVACSTIALASGTMQWQ